MAGPLLAKGDPRIASVEGLPPWLQALSLLSEAVPIAPVSGTVQVGRATPEVARAVKEAMQRFPRAMARLNAIRHGEQYAEYAPKAREILLAPTSSARTFWHELGHHARNLRGRLYRGGVGAEELAAETVAIRKSGGASDLREAAMQAYDVLDEIYDPRTAMMKEAYDELLRIFNGAR